MDRITSLSVCSLFVSTLNLKVPPNGPEGFLNDYTLKTKGSESKSNPNVNTCEQCDEQGTAVSYCNVCSTHLCESCTAAHKTMKYLKSHEIESLQSGKTYLPVKKDKILPCSQHPDKSLELYCKTCQCLVCMLCIVASHNRHDLGNIDSETRKGVQEQIEDLVTEVESKLAEYETNSEYVSEVEKETVEESVQIKGEINSLFDSIVSALETRRAVLLETVEASFNKDLKELWAQKEHVETTLTGLKGTLTFAKRSLQCTHDLELLVLGSQVMARLKELNKLQWESESTETIEKTARRFDHMEPVSLSTLGELKTTMIPNCLDISLEMSSSAQLGEPVEFNVALGIRSKTNMMKKQNQQFSVEILYGMARVKIPHPPTVIPFPNGRTWSVTFNPVVSGAHVVQVKGAKVQLGTDCEELKIETVINITARKPEPLLEVLLSVEDSPVQQYLSPAKSSCSQQDLSPAKSSRSQKYLPPAESNHSKQEFSPAESSRLQKYSPPAESYKSKREFSPAESSRPQKYSPPAESYHSKQHKSSAESSRPQKYLPPAESYHSKQDKSPAESSRPQKYSLPAESYHSKQEFFRLQKYSPPAESYKSKQDFSPAESSHPQKYLPDSRIQVKYAKKNKKM